jgi:hypothetical protein
MAALAGRVFGVRIGSPASTIPSREEKAIDAIDMRIHVGGKFGAMKNKRRSHAPIAHRDRRMELIPETRDSRGVIMTELRTSMSQAAS